ncbi:MULTISPECIES: Rpn family recombination-promoting nuclease/putative transposase [unclassified Clostridium]|uniref:Rpn family recombination-promoting nuclease/putative transposase n=1 Tax=unclassified Clostridium TaxID=2614128 RepID=UPI000297952A|nr:MULTISPECIES: Rpn family recombination-promoting nuclease/putative transposase [unclassified Clostridium]EKQ58030.1 MAG: Putative transposase, YhgA [Clostridium sp. Maddingley MBC34-26]
MGYKKAINNIHDRSYKDLYSNKEVFLNLVKEMFKASWAKDLREDNLVLVDKEYILSDYEENEADIVYRANIGGKEVIFYTLLEFQSTIDYRMPLRLFFYINEILREYTKNLTEEAKKNRKGFRVPAVVPIVLYNATRKWNAPRCFKDIVNQNELFGDNVVNFKYELFDVNHQYTKEELINNNNITSAIFLLDQKVDPLEFLERLKVVALEFSNLTDAQKMILKHWVRNTVDETIAENAVEILESRKEEVEKMVANNAFMIEEMKQKVRKETERETRKQERENIRLKDIERVKKLLTKKFGVLNNNYNKKIEELGSDNLNTIIDNILDIESINDLEKYF